MSTELERAVRLSITLTRHQSPTSCFMWCGTLMLQTVCGKFRA
jgi:hypothetical protein